jgi:hypothetical protein
MVNPKNIPLELVNYILQYDDRFRIRNGEIVNRICKTDIRYLILKSIPKKIYNIIENYTCVYLYINKDRDYYIASTIINNIPETQIVILDYNKNNLIYI